MCITRLLNNILIWEQNDTGLEITSWVAIYLQETLKVVEKNLLKTFEDGYPLGVLSFWSENAIILVEQL